MTEVIYLSLIIPAYNEEQKIERDLSAAVQFLQTCPFSWEVIVVDDGSQDSTRELACAFRNQLQKEIANRLRIEGYRENQGKGFAIKTGVELSRGERVAFVDSGLCVPYRFLLEGLALVDNGVQCALGSRRHEKSGIILAQPLHRRVGSKVFNFLMRSVLGIAVRDTQCGFKIYNGKVAREIFPRVETKGFMFDIEVLIRLRQQNYRVLEFPVEWTSDPDSRYHAFWGTFVNIYAILRIWLRCFCVRK